MQELILRNKRIYHNYSGLFQATFGLSLDTYWDALTGFDLTRFDDLVVMPYPDGTGCAEAVNARWGQEAQDLLAHLLGMEGC